MDIEERVGTKFEAAWAVFSATCSHLWAAEPSYQAWFAHYLISQFGIDRVAREALFNLNYFEQSQRRGSVGGGELRPDPVVTRRPGITMPHYANRVAKAADKSGALLKELAVFNELKVAASTQSGLNRAALERDVEKLSLLLEEHELRHEGPAPLAYLCVLDNHAKRTHTDDALRAYLKANAHPDVKLLFHSASVRPDIPADGQLVR